MPSRRLTAACLLVVVALALTVRAVRFGDRLVAHGPSAPVLEELGDELCYWPLGVNLARGNGYTNQFVEPLDVYSMGPIDPALPAPPEGWHRYYRAPAYPAFVAVILALTGGDQQSVRIVQWVLDGVTAALIVWLGLLVVGPEARRVGLIIGTSAGLLFAVLPAFVDGASMCKTIHTESLASLLAELATITTVLLARRLFAFSEPSSGATRDPEGLTPDARRDGEADQEQQPRERSSGWVLAIVTGGLFALLILTRPALLFVAPCVALVMLVPGPRWRWRVAHVAVMAVASFAIVLPWSIHASTMRGHFVLVSAQGGIAFVDACAESSRDGAWHRSPPVAPPDWQVPGFPDAPPWVREYEYRARHGFAHGARELASDPGVVPGLLARRLWNGLHISWPLWILAAVGLVGAFSGSRLPARSGRLQPAVAGVLVAWLLAYQLCTAMFYGLHRLLIPYLPALMIAAGCGVLFLVARLRRRHDDSRPDREPAGPSGGH